MLKAIHKIHLLLGALSLLTIQLQGCAQQFHFCSSFLFAMMDVVFDVLPTIAVTTWVGLLGLHLVLFAFEWTAVWDQQGAN